MPVYHVTSPDGHVYEVNAPEGATEQQAIAYVQTQHAAPQKSMAERYAAAGIDPTEGSDPTEGNSFLQNATIGFGKSAVDTVEGVQQLFGAKTTADVDARRKRDAALMNTGGGLVGNIAGQAAQMAVPVGEAGKVLSVAGKAAPYVGAALRAGTFAATQGVGTGESRLGNAAESAAFGAGGQAISNVASRAGKGMADKIAPEVMDLYKKAQAAGIPVHFSQLSDSKFVKTLASTLGYLPFTGAGAAQKAQQEAFNRAASRGFGHEAPVLTDDVISTAKKRLGAGYDQIFKRNNVDLDKQAVSDLFKLHQSVGNDLEASQAAVARKQIEKILDNAGQMGSMPGKVYQNLRGQLRQDFGKESALGRKVMEARKILDDAASRSLQPGDAVMLKVLNGQYANLGTVRDALKQVEGAKGNVKPAALWNLVKKGSTKEMRELAKVGQVLLKDPIPDSGTAGRLLATGGGMTAGALGGVAAAGPLLKLLLAGATVGRAANSKAAAKYLATGNKPLRGLAKLLRPAPLLLPATAQAEEQR
jgi:hypothetical protein